MTDLIKLDIDKRGTLPYLRWRYDRVRALFPRILPRVAKNTVVIKRTRKGYHITIIPLLQPTVEVIVLMQLLLGSDWLREGRNLQRAWSGDPYWNVLFSTKMHGGDVSHERPMPRGWHWKSAVKRKRMQKRHKSTG